MYSGGIRTSQEASEIIRKHQEGLGNTRPGRETSLGWEGRLYRKSRRDRDIKLNRDIILCWEVATSGTAGWAGRAAGRAALQEQADLVAILLDG